MNDKSDLFSFIGSLFMIGLLSLGAWGVISSRGTPESLEKREIQAQEFSNDINGKFINCQNSNIHWDSCSVLNANQNPIRILCHPKQGCKLPKNHR